MRVSRLERADDLTLELHPRVTVIAGLSPEERRDVVVAFRFLASGRVSDMTGLVEVHGIVLDLDEESLSVLDLGTAEVDVVVDATDLPHSSPPLEPGDPDEDTATERSTVDIAALGDLVRAQLALLRSFDDGRIRRALAKLGDGPVPGDLAPSPTAVGLVRELDTLDEAIEGLDPGDRPSVSDVDAAERGLEAARATLDELRGPVAVGDPSDDLVALEHAHAEVERTRAALRVRVGRAQARRRHDEAQSAEEALLDRLGLTSYTDYLTRGGDVGPGPVEMTAVAAARADVQQAADRVALLRGRQATARRVDELLEARHVVADRGRSLLAAPELPDDEVRWRLLELREPVEHSETVEDLLDSLASVGLDVRVLGLPPSELARVAQDWLDHHERDAGQLEDELADLDARAPVLEAPSVVAESTDPAGPTDASPPIDPPTPSTIDDIEWYLLARLAAQRRVTVAGSLPLVLDRALDGVEGDLVDLLDRLERLSGVVQIVHVSDDVRIGAWADALGPEHASVVRSGDGEGA